MTFGLDLYTALSWPDSVHAFKTTELTLCLLRTSHQEERGTGLPPYWCINVGHLVKGELSRFLCYKVTAFAFVINNSLVGRYFEAR